MEVNQAERAEMMAIIGWGEIEDTRCLVNQDVAQRDQGVEDSNHQSSHDVLEEVRRVVPDVEGRRHEEPVPEPREEFHRPTLPSSNESRRGHRRCRARTNPPGRGLARRPPTDDPAGEPHPDDTSP